MFITEWGRFCSKVGEVVEAITKRASYNKVGHKVNKFLYMKDYKIGLIICFLLLPKDFTQTFFIQPDIKIQNLINLSSEQQKNRKLGEGRKSYSY